MEIKKGISQMAEYPNVEINYVVPKSGNMHYVLKDGILDNGVIIATLDPRHAIDEANPCQNVGVFSANGDILVDFNKKDIKRITDDLLLVVNSVPTTSEVASLGDMTAESNRNLIVQMMMQEMGPTGEMIFEDPYSEANVYATDSYNNKLGLDCSFIGKNNEGLYFHTNDVNSLSKFIKVEEFGENELVDNSVNMDFDNTQTEDENQTGNEELQLNINPTILGGFNLPQDDSLNTIQNIEEPTMGELTSEESENADTTIEQSESTDTISDNEEMEKTELSNIDVEDDSKEDSSEEKTIESENENDNEDSSNADNGNDADDSINTEEKETEENTKNADIESENEKDNNDSSNTTDNNIDVDNSINNEAKETEENTKNEDNEEQSTENEEDIETREDSDLEQDENDYNEDEKVELDEDNDSDNDNGFVNQDDYDDDLEESTLEEDDDDEYEYRYKSKYNFEEEDDIEMEKTRKSTRIKKVTFDDINSDTEVLDDAIELINKMMEETDRLTRRIKKLETKLEQKEEIIREQTEQIEKQENKKNELNNILNKANRLLDNME